MLAVTFVFFARGWIGGGDAKLAAATALVARLRPPAGLPALCLAVRRRADARDDPVPHDAAARLLAGQEWVKRLHRKDGGVPYGIALAAAALIVYPDTIWMKAIALSRPPRGRCADIALAPMQAVARAASWRRHTCVEFHRATRSTIH